MTIVKTIFWISAFMIFWANIGYPISILILDKVLKRKNKKIENYEPTVTIMIVAHNEEKVIEQKIKNVLELNYPKNKITILITSDNSTDKTNQIVKKNINKYKDRNIVLYEVKERKGKTNAQNEAAKLVKSEIIVMTDANAMLDKDAIKELVSYFDKNVVYVTGKLNYTNERENLTSKTENTYWNLDTKIRDIESNIQTITAGNGALYAVKTKEYVDFDPIMCHDSIMPLYYALNNKRAIANHNAIAYEKAGENNEDEFKRKIRMSRITLKFILPSLKILNIFKYKWFTYFYLGHRTSRYLLWVNHILLFISNALLIKYSYFFLVIFICQCIIYLIAIIKNVFNLNNKLFNFISYYLMTVLAQFIGVVNTITRRNKPFWEKAESTR